ncbi:hypothetical protein [Thalassospira sp. TSL5-1]|uniref:hypothetical protein n=1 Tax=Thalassospira sp. TSL5-1 TaxID=1544451 RepID=UPI00093CF46F|nr:hypothetical protein [Thalassospira sp. TSL5-1]OKH88814.1 hypothetical protein LF95_01580 [Thalassospira sp. TSL5-1]
MANLPRLCWTVAAWLAFCEMLFNLQTLLGNPEHENVLPGASYINLVGWIGLALYGTYYRISRRHYDGLDKSQVFLAIIGALIVAAGTAVIKVGGPSLPFFIGFFLQLTSMGLFAWITLRRPIPMLTV